VWKELKEEGWGVGVTSDVEKTRHKSNRERQRNKRNVDSYPVLYSILQTAR
jgi:hypothetical protein